MSDKLEALFDLATLLNEKEEEQPSAVNKLNGTLDEKEGFVILPETSTASAIRPFHGEETGKGPQYVLQREKAHHRIIVYELAKGKTAGEIAAEFGFTPAMVYYVEKQPWAKEEVKNLIHQHGGDAVEKVLKEAALPAAEVLIRMKDDEKAPHAVRVNAAKEILDRIYGRSQQIINHRQVDPSDITDEELAKSITTRTGGQGTSA